MKVSLLKHFFSTKIIYSGEHTNERILHEYSQFKLRSYLDIGLSGWNEGRYRYTAKKDEPVRVEKKKSKRKLW